MDREIQLYSLSNGTIEVTMADYGCTIRSIHAPDRYGNKENIAAGFKDPNQYRNDHPYFGSTVGRFAGRIANGKVTIDGKEYLLPINADGNHLHGGIEAFHRKFWKMEEMSKDRISFSYTSENGEEGYPGNLAISVEFFLSPENELVISYTATTDAPTIINLTNHSYFNLTGFKEPTIREHLLQVFADRYTVKNENQVSSGEIRAVDQTPYDLRQPQKIEEGIDLLFDDQGYDINYVLNKTQAEPELAVILSEPVSGRNLKIYTDRPGMQVYTSNWWDGSLSGWHDQPYQQYGAIALETQAFPDSPNHSHFPNTFLLPGETFSSKTIFQFFTD